MKDVSDSVVMEALQRLIPAPPGPGSPVSPAITDGWDISSQAELALTRRMVAAVSALRPLDGIICEGVPAQAGSSGVRWVLDPVDGSVNAATGLAHVATSLAVEEAAGSDWHCREGRVIDWTRSWTYAARRGTGASCEGCPLPAQPPVALHQALIAMGLSHRPHRRPQEAALFARLIGVVRGVRILGATALDLCWLASGHVQAVVDLDASRWDLAAGALIAREAGATIVLTEHGFVAACPSLMDDILQLLEPGP